MSKNDSHIIIHHRFDDFSELRLIIMVCCIAMSVVVILVLLIILVLAIYMTCQKLKRNRPICGAAPAPPGLCETFQNAHRAVSNSYKPEVASRRSDMNPAMFHDVTLDNNSNVQNIPLSTFKTEMDGSRADSSNSSGLCDVLFPPRHDGEVIYEAPNMVPFAGKVYPDTSQKKPRADSEPQTSGCSTSRRTSDSVNASLEWDYFESRPYGASNASEGSEIDARKTMNVCWV